MTIDFNHRGTENTEEVLQDYFIPMGFLRVLCVSVVNLYTGR